MVALLFTSFASQSSHAQLNVSSLGPAPKTEDGRFENSVGVLSHGSTSVRLGFLFRAAARTFMSFPGAPEHIANNGSALRANGNASEPTVTWIGHATFLVQMDGVNFLTDPIWSERASPLSFAGPKRLVAPGVAIEDLPPIDFVVISHNHYDHLDLPTLVALAERDSNTRFIVPLENGPLLRKNGIETITELDWGGSFDVKGVTVYCTPIQHWSKRSLNDTRKSLWSSWAVIGESRRFFFAGDTGYFDGFAQIGQLLGPFDAAAIPIGAYEPSSMMRPSHMNPEEAAQAAIDLNTKAAIGMHFGTFNLTQEPIDEPPKRFRAAMAETALGESGGLVMKIGETRPF